MKSSNTNILADFNHTIDENVWPPNQSDQKLRGLTQTFASVGQILQRPHQFLAEIREGYQLPSKIWALFISSTLFLMIYGAVLGVGHPRLSLGAAVAVPFLFMGSLLTCLPVMYLLDVLSGSQRSLGQTTAVILTSTCVAATVFFSFAPIMIVFRLTGTIFQFFWLNLGIMTIATLVGLVYVTHGLIRTAVVDTDHALSGVNKRLHFLWMLLYLMVIIQMGSGMLAFFQRTGGFFGFF